MLRVVKRSTTLYLVYFVSLLVLVFLCLKNEVQVDIWPSMQLEWLGTVFTEFTSWCQVIFFVFRAMLRNIKGYCSTTIFHAQCSVLENLVFLHVQPHFFFLLATSFPGKNKSATCSTPSPQYSTVLLHHPAWVLFQIEWHPAEFNPLPLSSVVNDTPLGGVQPVLTVKNCMDTHIFYFEHQSMQEKGLTI